MPKRVLICLAIGSLSAYGSWFAQVYMTRLPGGDFDWAITAALDLLSGRDPYNYDVAIYSVPYPLPAAFVGLPFCVFPISVGAALFFGLSSGLLAYKVSEKSWTRLLIFTAMPFWFALVWAQWTPLIMAASFIPVLFPVVLIKPQIALPVLIPRVTKIGVYACIAVAVLSLAIYPTWPLVWLSQIKTYQRFFPLLTLPGPLLLLSLLRWKDPDAKLLFLIALFPQRHFYDAFTLWLIPKTAREIVPMCVVSWLAYGWKVTHPEMLPEQVGIVSVLCFFLPALIVVLSRFFTSEPLREISNA